MVAFASCSKEELPTTDGQTPDGTYTFNLGIEEPDYAPQSRGAVTMGRYMLEMYEGDLTAEPVKATNTNGVFTVEMKKNTDYVCLFWADNGADYTATDLKAVKQTNETKVGTAAYFTKVELNTKTFDFSKGITLTRAVAELLFIDKNGLTEASNSLKITYPYASATLNVGDGTVTHATGSAVRTIANITPTTPTTDAFATDFVLAPTAAGAMQGLKFQLNSEEEKTIAETAIQANYKTKIMGEYQPKPTPAMVGDFYMKDGTWLPGTTTLSAEQQADCIGIVYWTGDPTINDAALKAAHPNCTHGLVVALKEEISAWQSPYEYDKPVNTWTITNTTYAPILSGQELTDPINKIMGYNNTKAIEAFNAANSAYKVEAIEKVAAYQAAVETPASNSGWFLPSMKELSLLCGLDNQDLNVYNDKFGKGNRDAINAQLTKITNSTQISKNYYWSSTEYSFGLVWFVIFDGGATGTNYKNNSSGSVRVVSAF